MIFKSTISSAIRDFKVLWRKINKPKVVTLNGVYLLVEYKMMSRQVCDAIARKTYEQPEYLSVKKNLSENDVVLELGSGIGYITMQCARIVGDRNVHAFEPSPQTADLALRNFSLNKLDIRLDKKVVGSGCGARTFYKSKNYESSSLIERVGEVESVEVECLDVNEVIESIKPNFLIMDIEGGEGELISHIDFRGIDKVSIELHPHVVGDDAVSEVVAHLLADGFKVDLDSSLNKVFFFYKG